METQSKLSNNHVVLLEEGRSPEKIPIEALLKLARKEIGELSSYIDELEYKVQKLEGEVIKRDSATPEEIKEFKKSLFYKEMNEKFKDLNKTVKEKNVIITNLRKDNEKLLCSKLSNCRECISKRLSDKKQIKAFDLKTNLSHNVISISYIDDIVIMEHVEFGAIKRKIDEVKLFI